MCNQNQIPENFPNPLLSIYESINEVKSLVNKLLLKGNLTEPEEDKILTVKEASEFTRYSVPSIYRLWNERKLPGFKRGKKLLFGKKELTAWMIEGRRKTVNEIEENAEKHLGELGQKKSLASRS